MFERGFKSRCERIAVEQRRALNLAPDAPLPPRDLAHGLKIQIYDPASLAGLSSAARKALRDDSSSWSAVTIRVEKGAAIVLNTAHSAGRQASDLMHEIAHLILGHEPTELGVSKEGLAFAHEHEKQFEDEADWLAGCLLLPRPALIKIRAEDMDDDTATRVYGTSRQMLRYRIAVTGVDFQVNSGRRRKRAG